MSRIYKRIFKEAQERNDKFLEGKYYRNGLLFEKSLGRVYTHFNDDGFILGSAFRPVVEDPDERKIIGGVESNEENRERHSLLLKWLKKQRLGFFVVDGIWADPITKEKYPELSVFVPYRSIHTPEEFLEIALHWTSKGQPEQGHFDQDCVLVKDPDNTVDYHKLFLLTRTGIVKRLKGFYKPDQIAEIYSQFKKKNDKHTSNHAGRTFVFEGVQTFDKFYSRELLIMEGHTFV